MNSRDVTLLDDWRSGVISDEDFAELQERLHHDAELRSMLIAMADLEEGLIGLATTAPETPGSIAKEKGEDKESVITGGRFGLRRRIGQFAAAAALLGGIGVALWFAFQDSGPVDPVISHYDDRELPVLIVAMLNDHPIAPTTLKVEGEGTSMRSESGADVTVEGPALFGVESPSAGVLFRGSVRARLAEPENSYSVQVSNMRIVDLGTEFRVTARDDGLVEVAVLDGEIEVQSQNRLPAYYWNFDTPAIDSVISQGGEKLLLGSETEQVEGLVGRGAIRFNNKANSVVKPVVGIGDEVGTGGMAFSSGLSIEALIMSNWSGDHLDYDEIFRKEDGQHRVLLSFQNDGDVGDYDLPEIEPGPVLSFGLFIEGHGYSELDMPLDGKEGRPTVAEITDGGVHHIVATYDSFTGSKAIYIDGKLRFSHQFPVGSLILSGGPEAPLIGNHRSYEPFNGVIDELALYPFALSEAEITKHYARAKAGKPYFENAETSNVEGRWKPGERFSAGDRLLFDRESGRRVIE